MIKPIKRLTSARRYGKIRGMKKHFFEKGCNDANSAGAALTSQSVQNAKKRYSSVDLAKDAAVIALFCAVMIVFTLFVSIPFYPVPLTFQTTICVLCGLILGAKKGSVAMGVYFFMGFMCHLPVFSGGAGGFSAAVRPTFGYILGFILAAFISGVIAGNKEASFKRCCVAALSGVVADYALGIPYFLLIWNLYMGRTDVWHAAVYYNLLYLPKDLVLAVFAAVLAFRLKKALKK